VQNEVGDNGKLREITIPGGAKIEVFYQVKVD
jgi:hypothetical protein